MNHVERVVIDDQQQQQQQQEDDEYFRQMASTLVDNLLAKAIVKASQKLAFNSSTQNNEDIHHFNDNNNHNHNHNHHSNCDQTSCNNCGGYIQTKRKVSNPVRLKDPPSTICPSSSSSSYSSSQSQSYSSTNTTARTSSSSTPPMSSTVASGNTASASVDINGNAPEIQIDLVGPRTPSPVEESSFELPPIRRKQYKFKVQTNETNNQTRTSESSGDTKIRNNNINDDDDDDKNYIETNIDDVVVVDNNSVEDMYHCSSEDNNNNNNNKSQDNNTKNNAHESITITIKGNLKKNQYKSSCPNHHSYDNDNDMNNNNNNDDERGRRREHDPRTENDKNIHYAYKYEQEEEDDDDETTTTNNGQQQQRPKTTISSDNNNNNNNNNNQKKNNGKKQSKSIQIVEMAFDESTTSQVDVATTPELEIDLEQAQELSKHIVSDIINQAVKRLNEDIKNNKHLKHEPESISKISCYSSHSMVQNNCSWLTRTRHAIRRIVRHACICARSKEDPSTTLNDQPNLLNDATNNSGNHAQQQQQHRQHQCWSR